MPLPRRQRPRFPWLALLEFSLLLLWVLWIGRDYLDMSANRIPYGREFGMSIHPHFIWTQLTECGACVFWNGSFNGGYPAFTELHAGVLHPLVILTTLIWGGLNGGKLLVIASLLLAGVAQWWLARVLGLGVVARVWSTLLAAAGGHLASRMEIGVVGVVLSTAACSLALPAAIQLAQSARLRHVVVLALVLALALVSGQGYLQLGLIVALLPALLILCVDDDLRLQPVWQKFALAGLLALLLAGIFLVPLLHFWPQWGKVADTAFSTYQPLAYIPLNFVIADVKFYETAVLDKAPFPYLNSNYIGWTPILLALLALRLVPADKRRLLVFFYTAIALILWTASGAPFHALYGWWPEFAAGVRNPALISGLAVPLLLGLAAWSVDRLWQLNWPVLLFAPTDASRYARFIRLGGRVMLLIVLAGALLQVYAYGQRWLRLKEMDEMVTAVIQAIPNDDSEWINLPFGEHFWLPAAATAGMKLTPVARPSFWVQRPAPKAFWETTRSHVQKTNLNLQQSFAGLTLIRHPHNFYAYVLVGAEGEKRPCQAQARGGNIDVTCNVDEAGMLMVQENLWSGWLAWRDGQPIRMNETDRWLNALAPAGEHHYQFRYRPWDVAVGTGVSLIGLYLAAILWLRDRRTTTNVNL